MLMDADNVILLAQYLSNSMYMPVCKFTIRFLGQDRGQRSWDAKRLNFSNFCTLQCICVNRKKRPDTRKF